MHRKLGGFQVNWMNYKKPKRNFEKAGMVSPQRSYFVPLKNVSNTDKQDIKTMVDLGRYFTIFAPRQSGKTTYFNYFCRVLEKDSVYMPILLSFQRYGSLDVKAFYQSVQKKLYARLTSRLTAVDCPQLDVVEAFLDSHPLKDANSFYELFEKLNEIITFKKIVILMPYLQIGKRKFLSAIVIKINPGSTCSSRNWRF